MLPVVEIVKSIQGEGIFTGVPTIFLRFAGCNFAEHGHPCHYCDTPYAMKKSDSKMFKIETVIKNTEIALDRNAITHLCITGGEPLIHPEVHDLIDIWQRRYIVTVETNGSLPLWDSKAIWSMDIKCPGSGNDSQNMYSNFEFIKAKDQVKFVIADCEDYDFAISVTRKHLIYGTKIFQPAKKELSPAILAEWISNDKGNRSIRLGLQLHKYIWPRRKRGV
jgi:7-carboxy-7-deazaguanine synthase